MFPFKLSEYLFPKICEICTADRFNVNKYKISVLLLPRCRKTAAAATESSVELAIDMSSSGVMCPMLAHTPLLTPLTVSE